MPIVIVEIMNVTFLSQLIDRKTTSPLVPFSFSKLLIFCVLYEFELINYLQWTPPATYEQREKLGSGAFGVVYKCWDPIAEVTFVAKHTHIQSDQVMLLNIILSHSLVKTLAIQNMGAAQNEIAVLKNCSHEKIITYFGCKTEQNAIIIFMEYMPKGSLFQHISEHGPIIEQVAIDYVAQVLEGLTYIHRRAIVHSDLKCSRFAISNQYALQS